MVIRDIMTWNVITVPGGMTVMEARKVMEAHEFSRLPVVDRGELVGLVSRHRIDSAAPSTATSLSLWEINYLLSRVTVSQIMAKDVVTVTPDTTPEKAVQLAQSRKVGSLVVVENGKVVGMVTTNDFFYRILNKILGINEPGVRFEVARCPGPKNVADIMGVIEAHNARLITHYSIPPGEPGERNLVVHLDSSDVGPVLADIKALGYQVEPIER